MRVWTFISAGKPSDMAQLASIMEVLAKAAVVEITKLVEDSSAEIRLEMSRNQYENVALRRKLSRMESELVLARGCRETQGAEKSSIKGSVLHGPIQICDGVDKDGRHSLEESVFGDEWGGRQWKDGDVRVVEDDIFLQSITLTEEFQPMNMEKDIPSSHIIKENGPKRGLTSISKEGPVISEERPSDFCSTEMRPPTERQHHEARPETPQTEPIPTEHLEELPGLQRYRSSDEEDLEMKGVRGREPPTKLRKATATWRQRTSAALMLAVIRSDCQAKLNCILIRQWKVPETARLLWDPWM
ncbi:hypothetical protein COCON_G00177920 [Conger conger]|uniref:Uncharacterized protein n=1 Tax=Conger conger TaxID=82655 RepID=A0A9Q1D4M2_CONCO|nr:hypothetical protein COCON_G00177920 [Conger conger]